MSVIKWVLIGWAVLSCLLWCLTYLKATRSVGAIPMLKRLHPRQPPRFPKLSIIIPACNEGATLEPAVKTLLTQDYPDFELILVNDRSTDNTGDVIEQMSARDSRISPVHITDLPPGWLGKVHALHVATQKASGEWMLFTDADVHFQPGVLRKTVALCLEQQLDHLAVAPETYSQSFWLDVTLAAFALVFFTSLKAQDIGKPDSESFGGIGAFNLVRKSVFDRTEGFPWLKMEVADDLGLGLLLHRAGAKNSFAIGTGEIGLTWYSSLPDMVRGLEKNLFGGAAHYRFSKLFVSVAPLWILIVGWLIAFFYHGVPWLWAFGVAAYGCLLLYVFSVSAELKRWQPAFLLLPIGQLIISFILVRSALCCWRNQGIIWRGTLYPLQQLRQGQQVKL